MSFFKLIKRYPLDPILGLQSLYNQDSRTNKVNLGIGTYQGEQGQACVFNSVRKAEKKLLEKNLNKNYLPIDGYPPLVQGVKRLILGDLANDKKLLGMQTVGGTAAIRIALEFLAERSIKNIYLSDPTWINHYFVCEHLRLNVQSYPYIDSDTQGLNFSEMLATIEKMPPGSAILLHVCCHNPTGVDPSKEQWKTLSDILKKKKILPFFDFAYQGLGVSLEEDAWPLRYFYQEGHEMLIAYSFSKNLGLYGERVGALMVVTESEDVSLSVMSQIKHQTRMIYSTPSLQGGRVAGTILEDEELTAEWHEELITIQQRMLQMRLLFGENLSKKIGSYDPKKIAEQKGMFSLLKLSKEAILKLKDQFGIYILDNGRINVSGLNLNNIDYTVDAIATVMK